MSPVAPHPQFTFVREVGGIEELRHRENDLTVLLLQQAAAPVVTFMVTYSVGSRNEHTGLTGATLIRREGAPFPLKPLDKWDNGKDVVLAGDAAGVVAPSSGEGIYYAMVGGQVAATAASACLNSGRAKDLTLARKLFMREHKQVFRVLGALDLAY